MPDARTRLLKEMDDIIGVRYGAGDWAASSRRVVRRLLLAVLREEREACAERAHKRLSAAGWHYVAEMAQKAVLAAPRARRKEAGK